MRNFREALEVCELVDLGFSEVAYTYDNKISGRANVQVRLDRAVADNTWRNIFAESRVVHRVTPCSDYCAIILECMKEDVQRPRPSRRHYEVMWERNPSLPERIAMAWKDAGPKHNLGDIRLGLGRLTGNLQDWSKANFGAVNRELEQARNKLAELMSMNADRREIRAVTDKMNELLYREEMMWMQRSRINWLREGDRNTKFFHNKAVWRARKNKIKKLKDDNGIWQENSKVMGQMATNYFKDLFAAEENLVTDPVLELFEEKITPDMNDQLCMDFSDKEISYALFQIGPLKAPGPDGFPACFFQRN
jgi:hypothetical protein